MADNRPPKPRPYQPGETYIDMVTGQFKQVQVSGPDVVIPVAARETQPADTTRTGRNYGEYESAKAELESVNLLIQRANAARQSFGAGGIGQAPQTSVIFNEQTYDLAGLNKEISRLQALQTKAKKRFDAAEKIVKPLRDKVEKIKDQINGAGDDLARKQKFQNQLPAAQEALNNALSAPAKDKSTTGTTGSKRVGLPKRGAAAQTMTGTTTAAEAPEATVTMPASQNPSARNRIGGGSTTTTVGTGKTGKGGKSGKGNVPPPSTAPGEQDPFAGIDIERIKRDNPAFAWIFDLGQEFNDTKLLTAQYLNNDVEFDLYQSRIYQTSWFMDQANQKETRRIKNRYGDVLDSGSLGRLVTESVRMKYKDEDLDQAFFNTALSRNVMTGQYNDPKAAKAALASNPANEYRNYARSMFTTIDDKEIEDLLTGKKTAEDYDRTTRQVAKSVYSNWANLLDDPTMTMEKIVKPWRDMAANVLELDPSQIDMSKPQYSVAYANSANGQTNAMSLGDWYVKLRSDKTYGWDKTTQAKQEARELAYNIAKTFGKA